MCTIHEPGGELEKAQERGREYADLLLLALNDLGWGGAATSREDVELKTPPDVLGRSFNPLLGTAPDQVALEEREHAMGRAEISEIQFIVDTCVGVLSELDGEASEQR